MSTEKIEISPEASEFMQVVMPITALLLEELHELRPDMEIGVCILAYTAEGNLIGFSGSTAPEQTLIALRRAIVMLEAQQKGPLATVFADDKSKAN